MANHRSSHLGRIKHLDLIWSLVKDSAWLTVVSLDAGGTGGIDLRVSLLAIDLGLLLGNHLVDKRSTANRKNRKS